MKLIALLVLLAFPMRVTSDWPAGPRDPDCVRYCDDLAHNCIVTCRQTYRDGPAFGPCLRACVDMNKTCTRACGPKATP